MRALIPARGACTLAAAMTASACPNPPAQQDTSSSSSSSSSNASSSDTTAAPTSTTAADALPPAPRLVSPADAAVDVPIATSLCWDLAVDPDGDPLRYRVFIDDQQLTQGILGDEEGYPGPCIGPLFFTYERTYTWRVEAFETADPTRTSPPGEAWSFSTIRDGLTRTVFADDFDDDAGWQLSGDATSGAWVRGNPVGADDGPARSQSGQCLGGESCYFTGQNPDGVPTAADVAGGTTTLTSPPFDLGGAPAATVQLGRFFYKSAADPGPRLTVDLLVPRVDAPDEYDVFPLEQLAARTADDPENLWLPLEYTLCDVPRADGSRLRISATDAGDGVLEAAIDSVAVRAHDDTTVCDGGEGGACDPAAGPTACPADLLCCAQGVINAGVYRCTAPVAGLDFANPTADPAAPGNGPQGCDAPDLIVDAGQIAPIFHTIEVTNATCELYEGCVGDVGAREVMLFTVATPNVGSIDLVMGVPANHPDLFHYGACHDHWHFDEFARYELRAADDAVAATGHKQAFCMLDTISWAWPNALPIFTCGNQGISRGFSDFYDAGLPCQWIDISGVPAGDYTLHITLNQPRPDHALPVLVERDYTNNSLDLAVTVP